jgi:hypothetical protein
LSTELDGERNPDERDHYRLHASLRTTQFNSAARSPVNGELDSGLIDRKRFQ